MASRDFDQHEALPLPPASDKPETSPSIVLCSNRCGFFGSSQTNNLCSVCYKKSLRTDAVSSPVPVDRGEQRPARFGFFGTNGQVIKFGPESQQVSPSPVRWSFSPLMSPAEAFARTTAAVNSDKGSDFLRFSSTSNPRNGIEELVSSQLPETQVSPSPSSVPGPLSLGDMFPPPSAIVFPRPSPSPSSVSGTLSLADVFPPPSAILFPTPSAASLPVLPVDSSPMPTANISLQVPEPPSGAIALPVPQSTTSASGCAPKPNNRCHSCRKRLCLGATFKCRCGDVFCSTHRFPDQHACTFDIKAVDREHIAKSNPLIKADKLIDRI